MESISKALGAAAGGGVTGAGGGILLTAVGLLPAGSPAWAYVAVIIGTTAIGALAPFLTTYFAPANKPS